MDKRLSGASPPPSRQYSYVAIHTNKKERPNKIQIAFIDKIKTYDNLHRLSRRLEEVSFSAAPDRRSLDRLARRRSAFEPRS